MAVRQSAGILLFRRPAVLARQPEVLLGHPGGPFFARRDEGHWSIPKGEPDRADEDLLAVARREFAEEVGHPAPADQPDGSAPIALGTIVQKGGKLLHAWAIEGDLDPATARSNEFELEWPPRSGRRESFPEVDRVAWFAPAEARRRVKPTQIPFIDRLIAAVAGESGESADSRKGSRGGRSRREEPAPLIARARHVGDVVRGRAPVQSRRASLTYGKGDRSWV